VSSFSPWGISLIIKSVGQKTSPKFKITSLSPILFIIGLLLSLIPATESFLNTANPERFGRGAAYYVHTAVLIIAFSAQGFQVVKLYSEASGVAKLEFQFLGFCSAFTALSLAILNILGNALEIRILNRSSVFTVCASYLAMTWALVSPRVFNAKHIFFAVSQRAALVATLTYLAWLLANVAAPSLPPHVAWPLSMLLCGSAIFWLDARMRQWFGLDEASRIRSLRTEVLQVAMQGTDTARLTAEFESLLAVRYEAPAAVILARSGEAYTGGGHTIRRDRVAITALREEGWITPESLQRRRPNPALEDLDALLRELGAGALVAVPRESPVPNLLVAIGVRRSEWPFTYPDVTRLLHTAELIDNILTRSRLTDQLALRARMEYLAMMSRGLAHDLKNLITPVSSYLVHTEGRAPAGSAEEEVHRAASRAIAVITTYLREALFFSDRLTPRYAPIEPAGVLEAARCLAVERAARRGVTLVARSTYTGTLQADTVLLQRLLVNLLNNAIDASARGGEVRLTAEGPVAGMITLRVIDQGCGMDEATRARIFDPYFTTKEFGEEVRGFGLGLTISQRIAHLHHGRITVESRPGAGTTLIVDLPVDPAAVAAAS